MLRKVQLQTAESPAELILSSSAHVWSGRHPYLFWGFCLLRITTGGATATHSTGLRREPSSRSVSNSLAKSQDDISLYSTARYKASPRRGGRLLEILPSHCAGYGVLQSQRSFRCRQGLMGEFGASAEVPFQSSLILHSAIMGGLLARRVCTQVRSTPECDFKF